MNVCGLTEQDLQEHDDTNLETVHVLETRVVIATLYGPARNVTRS